MTFVDWRSFINDAAAEAFRQGIPATEIERQLKVAIAFQEREREREREREEAS